MEFYAHKAVNFILRVHPSIEKRASFNAKRNKCRVYFSKIHHMDVPVYKIVWRLNFYSGITEPQFSCLDLKQQFPVSFLLTMQKSPFSVQVD